jgi:hypothetical protein
MVMQRQVAEIIEKNAGESSHDIARTIWMIMNKDKVVIHNYPNRAGPGVIGFSARHCNRCGSMYNFYGGHSCNLPFRPILAISEILEANWDTMTYLEMAELIYPHLSEED